MDRGACYLSRGACNGNGLTIVAGAAGKCLVELNKVYGILMYWLTSTTDLWNGTCNTEWMQAS